jgi:hypothetical protein
MSSRKNENNYWKNFNLNDVECTYQPKTKPYHNKTRIHLIHFVKNLKAIFSFIEKVISILKFIYDIINE